MAKKYKHSASFIAKQKAKAKELQSKKFLKEQYKIYQERYYKELDKVESAGLSPKQDLFSYKSFEYGYLATKNELEKNLGRKLTPYEISRIPKEIADKNVYTYSKTQAKAIRTALDERIGRYSESKQKHTYISQFKEDVLAQRKTQGKKGQYISSVEIRAGGVPSEVIKQYYHKLRDEGLSAREASNEISETFYGSP